MILYEKERKECEIEMTTKSQQQDLDHEIPNDFLIQVCHQEENKRKAISSMFLLHYSRVGKLNYSRWEKRNSVNVSHPPVKILRHLEWQVLPFDNNWRDVKMTRVHSDRFVFELRSLTDSEGILRFHTWSEPRSSIDRVKIVTHDIKIMFDMSFLSYTFVPCDFQKQL